VTNSVDVTSLHQYLILSHAQVNKYLSQVVSRNASSNEELSNYVLEPWLPLLNAEVEEVEGLPQLTGFWAAVEKGKKVKAIRKGKKAGEDDGRLGESQEVTGLKGKAREVEVPEEQVVVWLIVRLPLYFNTKPADHLYTRIAIWCVNKFHCI
jgi:hypothetical protein